MKSSPVDFVICGILVICCSVVVAVKELNIDEKHVCKTVSDFDNNKAIFLRQCVRGDVSKVDDEKVKPSAAISSWIDQLEKELENTTSDIDTETRIVIVGRTGEGKSSTANSILGNEHFKAEVSAASVTKNCTFIKTNVQNKTLLLVDTPGLFDTDKPNNQTRLEIAKCLTVSSPGRHAFLLVMSTGQRFTEEITTSVRLLRDTFGKDFLNHTIVVFTRKDALDHDNVTIDAFLKGAPEYIVQLLNECNRRYIAVNNRLQGVKNKEQTARLLSMINDLVASNNGSFYESKQYKAIEERIRKELQDRDEKTEREWREKMDPIVRNMTKMEEENKRLQREIKKQEKTKAEMERLRSEQKQKTGKEALKYKEEIEQLEHEIGETQEQLKEENKKYEKTKKKGETITRKAERQKKDSRDTLRRDATYVKRSSGMKTAAGAVGGAVVGALYFGTAAAGGAGFVVGGALSYLFG